MDSEIGDVLDRICKRLDSQEFAITAYLQHQRDGPTTRIARWIVGMIAKAAFGYAMTLLIPRVLGWR